MKKLVAPIFLVSTLTGCGQSINCDTPEVKQTELQVLQEHYFGEKVQIESTTQFTDKKTGKVTCRLDLSNIIFDGKRESLVNAFVFVLDVADDNANFTVTPMTKLQYVE